ncbi:MAG: hypothetical protein KAU62_12320 [Candidatus Heimdallarchaeota archaeon]|nr:hypothetical protein [Candidatus Heimdallarchaeota archaeon]
MNQNQNSRNKQKFLDILTNRREMEFILQKYGEKGFDTFTGFLDWDFLGLNEIVEEELEFFETAQTVLSSDASKELLEMYGLEQKDEYNERIEKLTKNIRMKIQSGNLLQKYPEMEILFSIAAGMYLEHFNEERSWFEKQQQEEMVRDILRTLVQFYENLKQMLDVKDEANIIARKLIIFISMLDELTFCYDLRDTLSEREYDECNNLINEKIIRATMLDEIYKKRRKQQEDKKKLRNVCREIIADLGRALYLQWVLNYDEVESILDTLIGKIRMFIEEEVDLPYEKIIKQTKESFPNVYLRGEEVEEEKKRGFLEKIRKLEEYLKEYEREKWKNSRTNT